MLTKFESKSHRVKGERVVSLCCMPGSRVCMLGEECRAFHYSYVRCLKLLSLVCFVDQRLSWNGFSVMGTN